MGGGRFASSGWWYWRTESLYTIFAPWGHMPAEIFLCFCFNILLVSLKAREHILKSAECQICVAALFFWRQIMCHCFPPIVNPCLCVMQLDERNQCGLNVAQWGPGRMYMPNAHLPDVLCQWKSQCKEYHFGIWDLFVKILAQLKTLGGLVPVNPSAKSLVCPRPPKELGFLPIFHHIWF